MSIIIHTIGVTLSVAIITVYVTDLYKRSQEDNDPDELDLEDDEEREPTIGADLLWLGLEASKVGLQSVEDKTDKLFDSKVSKWLSWKIIEPFQLEPDGEYLKSRADVAWEGYGEDEGEIPVYRLGKFEMYI